MSSKIIFTDDLVIVKIESNLELEITIIPNPYNYQFIIYNIDQKSRCNHESIYPCSLNSHWNVVQKDGIWSCPRCDVNSKVCSILSKKC